MRAGHPRKKVAFFVVDRVALCFQQFAVLEANIDQPIARLCGDVNFDPNSAEYWEQLFQEHRVVVCTAEILHQCLRRAFITMSRINLVIFDEAHHCKKEHPYARIVKDFYIHTPRDDRPRLFGMSASPADTKENIEDAAAQLENLLHCKIATASDLLILQRYNLGQPKEKILEFTKGPKPYLTELATGIESRFANVKAFTKLKATTSEIAAELGECAPTICGR